jgi:hypothetical protein
MRALFTLVITLVAFSAEAQFPVCTSNLKRDATVYVDSVQYKLPGETTFISANPANTCILQDNRSFQIMRKFSFYNYYELVTLYPVGTLFKITLKHSRSSKWIFNSVLITGTFSSVYYSDEYGGSEKELVILAKTAPHLVKVGPEQKCVNSQLLESYLGFKINMFKKNSDEQGSDLFRQLTTVHYASLMPLKDWPGDYESKGKFEYKAKLFACQKESVAYDAAHETYMRFEEIEDRGINLPVLKTLTPQLMTYLFKGGIFRDEKNKVEVTEYQTEFSYGEKESLDGLPTSEDPVGLIFRIKSKTLVAEF